MSTPSTTENTNPGNFANRPTEEVKAIASMGGKASHGGHAEEEKVHRLTLVNSAELHRLTFHLASGLRPRRERPQRRWHFQGRQRGCEGGWAPGWDAQS